MQYGAQSTEIHVCILFGYTSSLLLFSALKFLLLLIANRLTLVTPSAFECAIKTFQKGSSAEEIKSEIELLRKCRSPYIVQVCLVAFFIEHVSSIHLLNAGFYSIHPLSSLLLVFWLRGSAR